MERSGDTRTLKRSDFVSIDEMLGIDSQMAVSLPTPSGIVIGFALNRDAQVSRAARPVMADRQ